jgi:formylglycine-generating enzyme required for sulfatase activity
MTLCPSLLRFVFMALLCWVSPACLHALDNQTAAIDQLFGAARPAAHDLLVLKNGDELHGQIANPAIQIHSSYGSITVEHRLVAGISLDSSPGHLDTLVLVNRSRFTGFINDPIEFEIVDGIRTSYSKHDLRKALFAVRELEGEQLIPRQFVILNNGDILGGALLLPSIEADTPSGTRTIPATEIEVIRPQKAGQIRLQLRDGTDHVARVGGPVTATFDSGSSVALPPDWIRAIYVRADFLPLEVRQAFTPAPLAHEDRDPPVGFLTPPGMVWIPPGAFIMGSVFDELGRGPDEGPQTEVIITRGFFIAQHEVTQGQYLALIGSNPSNFQGDTNRPVERVNWHEALEYCARLTEIARQQGALPPDYIYRLPTEAEWEYACRAGTTSRFSHGDDPTDAALSRHAWFIDNSDSRSQPVGKLNPNPWGLYDMHGNVWEWCLDIWTGSYPGGTVKDYTGPAKGWLRVARGGSWLYGPSFSRSANRDNYGPGNRCSDLGFRVVLAPEF